MVDDGRHNLDDSTCNTSRFYLVTSIIIGLHPVYINRSRLTESVPAGIFLKRPEDLVRVCCQHDPKREGEEVKDTRWTPRRQEIHRHYSLCLCQQTTMAADEDENETPSPKKRARSVRATLIDHTYYNYSDVTVEDVEKERDARDREQEERAGLFATRGGSNSNRGVRVQQPTRRERRAKAKKFPTKLHEIVSNADYRYIIRWMVRRF